MKKNLFYSINYSKKCLFFYNYSFIFFLIFLFSNIFSISSSSSSSSSLPIQYMPDGKIFQLENASKFLRKSDPFVFFPLKQKNQNNNIDNSLLLLIPHQVHPLGSISSFNHRTHWFGPNKLYWNHWPTNLLLKKENVEDKVSDFNDELNREKNREFVLNINRKHEVQPDRLINMKDSNGFLISYLGYNPDNFYLIDIISNILIDYIYYYQDLPSSINLSEKISTEMTRFIYGKHIKNEEEKEDEKDEDSILKSSTSSLFYPSYSDIIKNKNFLYRPLLSLIFLVSFENEEFTYKLIHHTGKIEYLNFNSNQENIFSNKAIYYGNINEKLSKILNQQYLNEFSSTNDLSQILSNVSNALIKNSHFTHLEILFFDSSTQQISYFYPHKLSYYIDKNNFEKSDEE